MLLVKFGNTLKPFVYVLVGIPAIFNNNNFLAIHYSFHNCLQALVIPISLVLTTINI